METNKHGKNGGSIFFWGLVMGGLLATLLITKRGRTILREVVNLGIELFEDFVEERGRKNAEKEEIIEASEDLESEITENEIPPAHESAPEPAPEPVQGAEPTAPPAKNGHGKKRLFRGIRRHK